MSRGALQEAGERTSPLDAMRGCNVHTLQPLQVEGVLDPILLHASRVWTHFHLNRWRVRPSRPATARPLPLSNHLLPHQPPGVWYGQALLYSSTCMIRCIMQRSAVTGIEDEFEQSSLYLHSLFTLQVGASRLDAACAVVGLWPLFYLSI